ncbi:uncharacterized protein LOC122501186 [Leptopilina heterotoma]|uniref:uncharacterized protein LOC122501186 n=1 Tax=Leptopilina heterotoma TaxID=63436 RepID=UPI001CA8BD27|nr:uncharacterized protein LOC122501186 [Leptopilina heterotoma]
MVARWHDSRTRNKGITLETPKRGIPNKGERHGNQAEEEKWAGSDTEIYKQERIVKVVRDVRVPTNSQDRDKALAVRSSEFPAEEAKTIIFIVIRARIVKDICDKVIALVLFRRDNVELIEQRWLRDGHDSGTRNKSQELSTLVILVTRKNIHSASIASKGVSKPREESGERGRWFNTSRNNYTPPDGIATISREIHAIIVQDI